MRFTPWLAFVVLAMAGCPDAPSADERCSTFEFDCNSPAGPTNEPGRVCIRLDIGSAPFDTAATFADRLSVECAEGPALGESDSGLNCGCFPCRSDCEDAIAVAKETLRDLGHPEGEPFCTNPSEC